MPPLLQVKNLSVEIRTRTGTVKAVRSATFSVADDEVLALVGESGSGKTVTAQTIMRLDQCMPPAAISGEIRFDGTDILQDPRSAQRRHRGIAIIFQDPVSALNPTMPVGRQIHEVFTHHFRLNRKASLARTLELLEAVGIPDPVRNYRSYPHQLSGGMCQRIMIAMALAAEPRLLIADEPTSSLDATVQARVLSLIEALRRQHRMSLILITHDLGIVAHMADKAAVMYAGTVVETAPVRRLFHQARHPYTRGLLSAQPRLDGDPEGLKEIPGDPPDMMHPPPGCPFRPRCPNALSRCGQIEPPSVEVSDGHVVKCWLVHPKADETR